MYRYIRIVLAAAALAVGMGACGGMPSQQHAQPAPVTASGPARADRAQAGIGPLYRLITRTRTSIDLTMYELADPVAEGDLAAAAARGVSVRVILDQHLEKSRNISAYDYLAARGVHVV